MNKKGQPTEEIIKQTKILAARAFCFLEQARQGNITVADFQKFASESRDCLETAVREISSLEKKELIYL